MYGGGWGASSFGIPPPPGYYNTALARPGVTGHFGRGAVSAHPPLTGLSGRGGFSAAGSTASGVTVSPSTSASESSAPAEMETVLGGSGRFSPSQSLGPSAPGALTTAPFPPAPPGWGSVPPAYQPTSWVHPQVTPFLGSGSLGGTISQASGDAVLQGLSSLQGLSTLLHLLNPAIAAPGCPSSSGVPPAGQSDSSRASVSGQPPPPSRAEVGAPSRSPSASARGPSSLGAPGELDTVDNPSVEGDLDTGVNPSAEGDPSPSPVEQLEEGEEDVLDISSDEGDPAPLVDVAASLSDAISLLEEVCPGATALVAAPPAAHADVGDGVGLEPPPASRRVLLESHFLAPALAAISARYGGSDKVKPPIVLVDQPSQEGAGPSSAPQATPLSCKSFPPAPKLPAPLASSLHCASLPGAPVQISRTDMDLLGSSPRPGGSYVQDHDFECLESASRNALAAASAADSFLRGLVCQVRAPGSAGEGFSLRHEIDVNGVYQMARRCKEAVSELFTQLAYLYGSSIMLRRDCFLSSSDLQLKSQDSKRSLRAAPLPTQSSGLFGPPAAEALKDETNRLIQQKALKDAQRSQPAQGGDGRSHRGNSSRGRGGGQSGGSRRFQQVNAKQNHTNAQRRRRAKDKPPRLTKEGGPTPSKRGRSGN